MRKKDQLTPITVPRYASSTGNPGRCATLHISRSMRNGRHDKRFHVDEGDVGIHRTIAGTR